MNKEIRIKEDKDIIDGLGGCAAVARLLNLDNSRHDGTRFVYSWYQKGIPYKWKLKYYFLRRD